MWIAFLSPRVYGTFMKMLRWIPILMLQVLWMVPTVRGQIVLPDYYIEEEVETQETLVPMPEDAEGRHGREGEEAGEAEVVEVDAATRRMMQQMNFAVQRGGGFHVQQMRQAEEKGGVFHEVQARLLDGPERLKAERAGDGTLFHFPNQTLMVETAFGIVPVRLHQIQRLKVSEVATDAAEDADAQPVFTLELEKGDQLQGHLLRPMLLFEDEDRLVELDAALLGEVTLTHE